MATQRWDAEVPSILHSSQGAKGKEHMKRETQQCFSCCFPRSNSLRLHVHEAVAQTGTELQTQQLLLSTRCPHRILPLRFIRAGSRLPCRLTSSYWSFPANTSPKGTGADGVTHQAGQGLSAGHISSRLSVWTELWSPSMDKVKRNSIHYKRQAYPKFCMEDTTALGDSTAIRKRVTLIMKPACIHI